MEGIETEEQPIADVVKNRTTKIKLMGFIKTCRSGLFGDNTRHRYEESRIKRHLLPLTSRYREDRFRHPVCSPFNKISETAQEESILLPKRCDVDASGV